MSKVIKLHKKNKYEALQITAGVVATAVVFIWLMVVIHAIT